MGQAVTPEATDTASLALLIAVAGPLHLNKMGLYTNNFQPTKGSNLAAFQQPTYPGYALQSVVWGPVSRNANGQISTTSGILAFQMSDATLPTTCYGVVVTDTAGTVLITSAAFDTPQPLVDALSVINAAFEYIQSNPANGAVYTVE